MIKPKPSAEQEIENQASRKALNPNGFEQAISDNQAMPEFSENHNRLRAERQAREAELKAKTIERD